MWHSSLLNCQLVAQLEVVSYGVRQTPSQTMQQIFNASLWPGATNFRDQNYQIRLHFLEYTDTAAGQGTNAQQVSKKLCVLISVNDTQEREKVLIKERIISMQKNIFNSLSHEIATYVNVIF